MINPCAELHLLKPRHRAAAPAVYSHVTSIDVRQCYHQQKSAEQHGEVLRKHLQCSAGYMVCACAKAALLAR